MKTTNIRMTRVEKAIVTHIAQGWSRAKDTAQPGGLVFDIQFALGCGLLRAKSLADWVRSQWGI